MFKTLAVAFALIAAGSSQAGTLKWPPHPEFQQPQPSFPHHGGGFDGVDAIHHTSDPFSNLNNINNPNNFWSPLNPTNPNNLASPLNQLNAMNRMGKF